MENPQFDKLKSISKKQDPASTAAGESLNSRPWEDRTEQRGQGKAAPRAGQCPPLLRLPTPLPADWAEPVSPTHSYLLLHVGFGCNKQTFSALCSRRENSQQAVLSSSQFPDQRARLNNSKTFPRTICFFHMNFESFLTYSVHLPQLFCLVACLFFFFKEKSLSLQLQKQGKWKDCLMAQRVTFWQQNITKTKKHPGLSDGGAVNGRTHNSPRSLFRGQKEETFQCVMLARLKPYRTTCRETWACSACTPKPGRNPQLWLAGHQAQANKAQLSSRACWFRRGATLVCYMASSQLRAKTEQAHISSRKIT